MKKLQNILNELKKVLEGRKQLLETLLNNKEKNDKKEIIQEQVLKGQELNGQIYNAKCLIEAAENEIYKHNKLTAESEAYLNNIKITYEDFLTLCDIYNIKVPARTKGHLKNAEACIKKGCYSLPKKMKVSNIVLDLSEKLYDALLEDVEQVEQPQNKINDLSINKNNIEEVENMDNTQLKSFVNGSVSTLKGLEIPKGLTFEYMNLNGLKYTCEYYLNEGNRNIKFLSKKNEVEQIKEMKKIYNDIPENQKPNWLTWEDILKYEREMVGAIEHHNIIELEEFYNDFIYSIDNIKYYIEFSKCGQLNISNYKGQTKVDKYNVKLHLENTQTIQYNSNEYENIIDNKYYRYNFIVNIINNIVLNKNTEVESMNNTIIKEEILFIEKLANSESLLKLKKQTYSNNLSHFSLVNEDDFNKVEYNSSNLNDLINQVKLDIDINKGYAQGIENKEVKKAYDNYIDLEIRVLNQLENILSKESKDIKEEFDSIEIAATEEIQDPQVEKWNNRLNTEKSILNQMGVLKRVILKRKTDFNSLDLIPCNGYIISILLQHQGQNIQYNKLDYKKCYYSVKDSTPEIAKIIFKDINDNLQYYNIYLESKINITA